MQTLVQELKAGGYLKTPSLIRAFQSVRREDFVRPEDRERARENYPLPIGFDQTISQPLVVALMLEMLSPRPGEKILDAGAGSGWTAALLAELVGPKGRVVAVERIRPLSDFARANLQHYPSLLKRIDFVCADATADSAIAERAPFDKILSGAAASKTIPRNWRHWLKIGGRIVAPINYSIWIFNRSAAGWEEREWPGFTFVPLIGGESA